MRPRHALTILAVSDLARAVRFYRQAFGWPTRVEVPVYVELELPDGRGLSLFEPHAFAAHTGALPAPVAASAITGCELYLRCGDVDAAIDRAREAGASVLAERARKDWGDEVAYLRDPDGNVLALASPAVDPEVVEVEGGRGELCRSILEALPAWFGIAEAIETYAREVEALPVFAALDGDERVGLISIREHTAYAAEIHVLGVLPGHHRRGLGKRLLGAAERFALQRGLRFLTVKTLSPAREDAAYARTRAFYRAMGFVPLEEFPTLWGPANPCLLMAKSVG
jgi:predicted enzyme related to lactoylglutathione lyase/GNAT superfamily N-acetyltransferase